MPNLARKELHFDAESLANTRVMKPDSVRNSPLFSSSAVLHAAEKIYGPAAAHVFIDSVWTLLDAKTRRDGK